MRTAPFLAVLLLTSIALSGLGLAAPPTEGNTVTVTDSETWVGGSFEGTVVVAEGGALQWSGEVAVKQNSKIIVEEGGTLHMEEVTMVGEGIASTLLIYDGTNVTVDENIDDDDATLNVYFNIDVPETAYLNLTVGDATTNNITGESASFTVDLTQPVDILVDHNYPLRLGIAYIELFHSNAELLTIPAEDLVQQGGNVIWNAAAFDVENYGATIIKDSMIQGANITCVGTCSIEESYLYGSGPIQVMDGSHINFEESTMLGSRTDEDIILHDQATINYENSTGTGGYTDAWIRLLSKRELVVNAPTATVTATGIGYNGNTINTVIIGDPLNPSTWNVNIGTSEHKRIVEWVDGNGVYNKEAGTIKITVESNWGNFVADAAAPQVSSATIDVVYPQLSIDKVEPESVTGETNRGKGVMVTISNIGTVAADPNVRCYVDDVEAQTTANSADWAVVPGQTKDVPITWYHNSDGAVKLDCRFLYPDVLEPVSEAISSETGTKSSEVSWTTAEEVEDLPLVLYAVIVVLVLLLTVFVVIQARVAKLERKEYMAGEMDEEETPFWDNKEE